MPAPHACFPSVVHCNAASAWLCGSVTLLLVLSGLTALHVCCCTAIILCFMSNALQLCYPSYVGLPLDATDTTSSSSASYASAAAAARHGSQPDAIGVCAPHQPGLLLPRAYPTPWSTPVAYFPLSQVRHHVVCCNVWGGGA
jgi:hypothetical protein